MVNLRNPNEPVAWMDTFGNVFSDKSVTEEMQCGLDPLYTAISVAAARVAENERCLALMDSIGCDWRDAGDMAKFYATNYLCDAISALLGKEQS